MSRPDHGPVWYYGYDVAPGVRIFGTIQAPDLKAATGIADLYAARAAWDKKVPYEPRRLKVQPYP